MPALRLPLLFCLLLTLTACGSLHQRETIEFGGDQTAWKNHRATLEPLDRWILQGKLGIRSPQESGSGTLFWLQRQRYFDIRLSGPLGRGATRIQGDRNQTTLEVAGHAPVSASSAEELVAQQIGWRLPVDHLLWWVRGLPAPNSTSRLQLDSHSRLGRLEQSGWTIEYSRYQQVGDLELPQRLQISGHDLLLTLVITEWKPGINE
ncbi:lipoprotein insertase outer membrane protein LolB [Halopseudomonas oceani]|uniref:lipoprotein insertase outer membrane protein LolB n=1 Tax=Halopseudomonas oceani TaxID=1708783 RepID=UPI002AA94375|nr:lipoprotein insertase outer membrane protein LolB [Halopseudomonas oceani]